MSRDVYIVDGARTPFIKAGVKPNPLAASDLAVACAKPLLERQPFSPTEIGEVVIGCVGPSAAEANIARIIALRIGCGNFVPAYTVQRNCASGMQAIDCAAKDISMGRHELVLAGGTEAMSRAGLAYNIDMLNWLGDLSSAKNIGAKIQAILKFRPHFLTPVVALLKALTDPVVNLNMGQTAEKVAFEFGITRAQMDEYALQSHLRACNAIDAKIFATEVEPLFDWLGNCLTADNGVRPDSSLEKLAKLKPVFDKPFGIVTAGNSSQISDGASLVFLASENAIDQHKLKPLAKIVDFSWVAIDPSIMGMGPAYAIADLLKRNNLALSEIDFIEINEAFAAQVLACVKVLNDAKYCKEHFDVDNAIGKIDMGILNVDGGAIAIGHPVGATGARLTLHLAQTLARNGKRLGIATLCIGGGQGGAILIENVSGGL